MFDPIRLAEQAKEAYALHFMGRYHHKLIDVLNRLEVDAGSPFSRRDEFMKVRGPYLQALPLPAWSDTSWEEFARSVRGSLAPDGLRPEVVNALSAMGFKRLHQFQEETVRRICEDKDTLVVAATGRGKSESWLIPIFHHIVTEKLTGKIKGTKALLLYPTKALAQDQFRRIIGYLLEINRRLPKDRPITVGVLDGDTPFDNDQNKVAFLRTAFQFMDCPGRGTKDGCQDCPLQQVTVDPIGERLVLTVSQEACRKEYPLDFVYLTREDVRDGQVDIVLTNPDLLNFQLININNRQSRKQLIGDPKFIVLDEVHTYSGLFGNFTAALLRRLKLVREQMGQPEHDLRFIAASATVANKKEIFQQLCGVSDPDCVVEEVSAPLVGGSASLPDGLGTWRLDEDEMLEAIRLGSADPYGGLLNRLGLHMPGMGRSELVELLLERIVHSDLTEWDWVRLIYQHMNEQAPLPHELQSFIRERFDLPDEEAAGAVLHNFIVVGGLAGILERRAHLFAWALDGYYKCPDCDAVYTAPVAACKCGQEFISRFAFCTHCGEEVVEAWACPVCRSIYPMVASRNGEAAYFDAPICHCDGQAHETIRCVVHPEGRSHAITCPDCGAWTAAEGEERICTNPTCDWHGPQRQHQGHASGQPTVRRCLSCGHTGTEHDCPSCGERTQPSRSLEWVTVGRNSFLNALFQVDTVVTDGSDRSFLPGMNPALVGAVRQDSPKQTYQVIDQHGQVREVKDAGGAILPCSHPNAGWRFDRFNPMVRTPENILATSSQFLLRSMLQENGEPMDRRLKNTKMLTFSDSIRDMEAVNRNFNEPEREHFLEALAYRVLTSAGGRLTLADLADRVLKAVENYGAEVHDGAGRMSIFADLAPGVPSKARRSTVEGMILDLIRPSRRNSWVPSLTASGICNTWPDASLLELPAGKREALALVWKTHQGRWASDVLDDKRLKPEVREAIRRLFHEDKVLVEERNRLFVDRRLLHVTLVGPTHPGNWDPRTDRFVTTADLQLAGRSRDGLVQYSLPLEQRAEPWSRHFSLAAYELLYSPAALLVSRVYKGDTAREVRRLIEFEFKNRSSMHHISSGPAMEVGVDIGNLNIMALYGTPPNINAYLQRIGRAGRKSKRALVFTVSKSNPIDFYYHREPRKLIASGAQPVPLTISNQEVARVCLAWAVLDFISTKYWVPWVRTTFEDVSFVEATDPVVPVGSGPAPKYLKLTNLLFGSLRYVNHGQALTVLNDIVTGNRSDLASWLRRLLGPEIPAAEATTLVEEVLREFVGNIYGFIERLQEQLDSLWDGASLELESTRRKHHRATDPRDRALLDKRMRQLRQTMTEIEDFRDSLESKSVVDVQQMTEQKRYAYNLRNVSSTVTVYLRKAGDGEEAETAGMEMLTSRELGLALREYYPAATVLRDEQPHVVVEMHEAEFPTLQLRGQFGEYRWACENCGALLGETHPGACPHCGESQRIRRAELVVPGRVVIAPGTAVLQESPVDGLPKLTAQMLYRTAGRDTDIKATYPESDEQALPIDQVDEEIRLGDMTLGFAWVDLATFVHGFSAVYADGRREPPSLLEVCSEPGCGGVYRKGSPSFCSKNPTHDTAKKRWVLLGRTFRTRAIVITVFRPGSEGERMAHTVAHGLRMALQHVAGVDIRQLGELDLGGGQFLVYEDVEGGYGIVDLLRRVDESGRRTHLEDAVALVRNMANSACCDDGCPYCLMQYGCTHRNRTGTFAKQKVRGFLTGGVGDSDGEANQGV